VQDAARKILTGVVRVGGIAHTNIFNIACRIKLSRYRIRLAIIPAGVNGIFYNNVSCDALLRVTFADRVMQNLSSIRINRVSRAVAGKQKSVLAMASKPERSAGKWHAARRRSFHFGKYEGNILTADNYSGTSCARISARSEERRQDDRAYARASFRRYLSAIVADANKNPRARLRSRIIPRAVRVFGNNM